MSSTNSPPSIASSATRQGQDTDGVLAVPNEKTDFNSATNESTILTGRKLAVVYIGMLMSVLLIALDQTILGKPKTKIIIII